MSPQWTRCAEDDTLVMFRRETDDATFSYVHAKSSLVSSPALRQPYSLIGHRPTDDWTQKSSGKRGYKRGWHTVRIYRDRRGTVDQCHSGKPFGEGAEKLPRNWIFV